MSTNWSNTWKHAGYCAFMYTLHGNTRFSVNVYMKAHYHACFHVLLQLVLTFDPHWKRVHFTSTYRYIVPSLEVQMSSIYGINIIMVTNHCLL